jgi:hypothetical protein
VGEGQQIQMVERVRGQAHDLVADRVQHQHGRTELLPLPQEQLQAHTCHRHPPDGQVVKHHVVPASHGSFQT